MWLTRARRLSLCDSHHRGSLRKDHVHQSPRIETWCDLPCHATAETAWNVWGRTFDQATPVVVEFSMVYSGT